MMIIATTPTAPASGLIGFFDDLRLGPGHYFRQLWISRRLVGDGHRFDDGGIGVGGEDLGVVDDEVDALGGGAGEEGGGEG